jgi:hypothetical protein
MLTDSKLLFEVITGNKYTTEKGLMADIASTREAYKDRVIANIALIRSEHNTADAMTKFEHNSSPKTLMRPNQVTHPVEQYVMEQGLFSDKKEG